MLIGTLAICCRRIDANMKNDPLSLIFVPSLAGCKVLRTIARQTCIMTARTVKTDRANTVIEEILKDLLGLGPKVSNSLRVVVRYLGCEFRGSSGLF